VLIGNHRHLETRGNKTLHISNVSKEETGVRIQLKNVDPFTRVHVIANRYRPAFNSFSQFAQISDLEPWINKPPLRKSAYMEGRKIGDEYAYMLAAPTIKSQGTKMAVQQSAAKATKSAASVLLTQRT